MQPLQCSKFRSFQWTKLLIVRCTPTVDPRTRRHADCQSREKIIRYIDKLGSAGQNDTHQLTIYALAYLKELHEGPDPRFTGC